MNNMAACSISKKYRVSNSMIMQMIIKYFRFLALSILIFFAFSALALRFSFPESGNNLFGRIQFVSIQEGYTFASIAHQYDVGYFELVEANPEIDPNQSLPGTALIIPTRYLLPHVSRDGIIVNLATMRLYYFPKGENCFYSYPVGIARFNWASPLGKFRIVQKIRNPVWVVPDSIFRYRQENGDPVPRVVPSGPNNPLGYYALRLSNPTYLIHGTNDPGSVGRRSSAGCIHLYPEDIRQLFTMVSVNTPVLIINQPYVVGLDKGKLYIEAHLPLKEQRKKLLTNIHNVVMTLINDFLKNSKENFSIDWQKADEIIKEHVGIPTVVNFSGLDNHS